MVNQNHPKSNLSVDVLNHWKLLRWEKRRPVNPVAHLRCSAHGLRFSLLVATGSNSLSPKILLKSHENGTNIHIPTYYLIAIESQRQKKYANMNSHVGISSQTYYIYIYTRCIMLLFFLIFQYMLHQSQWRTRRRRRWRRAMKAACRDRQWRSPPVGMWLGADFVYQRSGCLENCDHCSLLCLFLGGDVLVWGEMCWFCLYYTNSFADIMMLC